MKHPSILVSIVIPSYNYAETLPRAVGSVVNQLKQNHELIVIDDGSTDGTQSVIAQLRQTSPQSVRFIHKENGGLSSVRNRGIREASGTYLVFLDADDELLPDALEKLERHILEHPETRMVIGGHISVLTDTKKRTHLPSALPKTALGRLSGYLLNKEIVCCNGACAMHKTLFTRGDYPEYFRSAEDIPVFAQSLANFPCTTLQEPLALIYKHHDSLRHQFTHAKAGGLLLVDEVFSEKRLGPEFQHLRSKYLVKRSLSLFRSAYLAGDFASAKDFFRNALKHDWRVLLSFSYTKKALRIWLK